MEKEKEKRYQSVSELHSELKSLEKGIPQTEMAIPERKPLTSKEITVTVGLKKLITPALIVIAILAVGLIIWSPWTPKIVVPPSLEKPSIAVLPFEDLSPQMDQRHLCDGIAESIIMALSKVDQLRIPASTSSFLFRGKDVDVQEIGEKLNVEILLTGSVQKAGNRLRLWAQLINIEDESILWNEQYDHEVDDIFTIQDEITLKIIDVLKVKLLGEDRTYIVKRYTEDSEAYNLYLKGRHFWNLRTKDGLNRALDYFQMAIETDQSYALAYSGLADCYSMLPWYGDWLPEEAYSKAKTAALNAIKIDGQLSEAYASLAIIKNWFDWDWQGAENEYKRAIELNPSYASAHQWYAFFLSIMGRNKEAIEEAKLAVELDPLSLIIITNLGDRFFEDRQYDKAIEQYYKALEINSDFASSLIWLGKISLIKKKYEDALEKFTKTGHPHVVSALMGLGKKEDALNCLNEWTKRSLSENVDQVYLAFAYLGVRDMDLVFEHIENAFSNHYPRLLDFILDPYVIDILQSDPRFTELLKKMKLE
jgi:TolB-like protein/Tfp pilus assembly protein PilF